MKPFHTLVISSFAAVALSASCINPLRGEEENIGDNFIANGNLENPSKKDKWPDKWAKPKTGGTWEKEGDNHFLRLTSTKPGEMVMLYQQFHLPAEIKALEISWKERVTNLKVGAKPWFDARILFEFLGQDGKKLEQKPSPSYTQKDTKGWVDKNEKFLVPENAESLVLMISLFQVEKGTYDLDDFDLKGADPKALEEKARVAEATKRKSLVAIEAPVPAKFPQELHVEGNRIFNKEGKEVWLQGVNAGGLESVPQDKQMMKSALVAVDDWKANVVRLPVKGEFWFGKSPYQQDGGKGYREMVDNIVALVANRGAYLLLDLHRFRAPTQADADFWTDAAERYKNHPAVLFDLFNEPHDISWDVWQKGGFVAEKKEGVDESAFLTEEDKIKNHAGFRSIGMQALVNAVRATEARNIVVAGGLAWANDLSGVAAGHALDDKTGLGIIYSWHTYNWHKNWQGMVLGAAEKYPILVGELGADTNKMTFIPLHAQEDPYTWVPDMLGFIQKYKLNWTGWCLHPKATPVMISDWDYTPTPFWGAFAKRALAGEKFEMKKMR